MTPVWSHSGRELFYINGNGQLVAAQVETSGGFRVGERHPLFSINERQLFAGPNYASWDVAPDDKRFLFVQLAGGAGGGHHDLIWWRTSSRS